MTYLDTGCFVKLYYPEPDSAKVVALIQGKPLCHIPLHLALRRGEGFGRQRIHHHGFSTEESRSRDGIEPGDILSSG